MASQFIEIPLTKINLNKRSIAFTWDDNEARQLSVIAPLFVKNELRCTFYIVPGEKDFALDYAPGYVQLARQGFELGSHSFTHQKMTQLSPAKADEEFSNAAIAIEKLAGIYPVSFAFPHHDYNDELLAKARTYHLETRNTLINSKRVALKTLTILSDVLHVLEHVDSNLVFSGHSVITKEEIRTNKEGNSYEPVNADLLENLLPLIKLQYPGSEIITFAQACLKEFIRLHRLTKGLVCRFDSKALAQLHAAGINSAHLTQLL